MGVCRAMHGTRKGREGGRAHSSFLPHNGLHFFPRAVCINIQHSLARARRASARGSFLRKYWFLLDSLSLLPRTNSIKGRKRSFPFLPSPFSWLVESHCGASRVERRRRRRGDRRRWRSQTLAGARRGRQTYQTPSGGRQGRASHHTHFHTHTRPYTTVLKDRLREHILKDHPT